ncbi:MAG TPA: DeoR/GlpR family DNA-binding transcription regulator [Ramlibacter sp.]|jgi:DeoR/GlpR family transcriptional regulator of sugar metabolism
MTNSNWRQTQVLQYLETEERVSVADLARQFGVSDMTVRRDLEHLEQSGAINRVHGGAVRAQSRSYEPPFAARAARRTDAKRRIAVAAAALLSKGETVILDAGTTTLEIARELRGQQELRVLAMSLHVANLLLDQPQITLMMCGGVVRLGELSLTGALAERTFVDFSFDTYFMSAGGIDLDTGVTEYNPEDAAVKRAAFANARRRIVVADGSKIGATAFARVCSSDSLDMIITDGSAPVSKLSELRDAGIEVVVV